MKQRTVCIFALILAAHLTALTISHADANSKIKVANKVALKAWAFDLKDVRLLDGPFRDAMLRDQKFLLSIDADRLLHTYRINGGLSSSAKPLGGWEAPDVELRGHSLGHFISACALMYSSTGDERFKTRADATVAELAKVQQAMTSRGFHAGYLSAFPEEFFDRVDTRQKVWAPYYTLHKIMAGLLDVYMHCDNQQALDVLTRLADWVKFRVDRLSDEQQQRALETEFGGMNEVLANLYAVTGNSEYLRVARKFDHRALFDPLSRGEDPLNRLHANTQIPKMIGAAREYELTGEKRYYDIATFFWERVAKHRSYVIGGHSDGEDFFPPETFSKHLGVSSTETCNTYNMLKLSRKLFSWEPSAETMDFYERGLYNHILASQDPSTGMMCYYVPLKPGAFKTYSKPEDSFWCCTGTGMENHAKYPDTIYFHNDQSLYVNLFIASELNWKEKGLTLRQETRFPEEETTGLTFKCAKPVRLALKIRSPDWAGIITVTVNGKQQPAQLNSYVTVEREWKNGDTVSVRLPMSFSMEYLPYDQKTVALMYGPIVLAGQLGNDGLDDSLRYGPLAPQIGRVKPIEVPSFVVDDPIAVLRGLAPVTGAPLHFRTVGLGRPQDVSLAPFYQVSDQRYSVYWKIYSPEEWEKRKGDVAAAVARRKEIELRTVDRVSIGDNQSEPDHGFKGENSTARNFDGRKGREARNGWFSYELKVARDKPVVLVCTYRGSEGGDRMFDVFVNGEKIAYEALGDHPAELFDIEYPLPLQLTRGKDRVTVKFQARIDATAGGVFDVRVVQ